MPVSTRYASAPASMAIGMPALVPSIRAPPRWRHTYTRPTTNNTPTTTASAETRANDENVPLTPLHVHSWTRRFRDHRTALRPRVAHQIEYAPSGGVVWSNATRHPLRRRENAPTTTTVASATPEHTIAKKPAASASQ